ncbi:MAG: ABC transporter permease [Fastidiosipila sp.]|jgi:peptide/nickel transport system permease protein|nr:ABC transporter permease [Fastidiosipila sp.]
MNSNNLQHDSAVLKKSWIKTSTKENLKIYWYNFRRNKLSLIGLIIVLICISLALFPQLFARYPAHVEAFVDYSNASKGPSSEFWFGTDNYGRDIYTRVIYSFRGALVMAIVVLAISVPIGTTLGLIAGYFQGTIVDTIIMRLTDIFLAIPPLILAMSIASLLEPNMTNTMIAITVSWWPWYTRLVYTNAASHSQEYYVKNAELIGASTPHVLFKEVLPNCMSPILTKMALDVGWVIIQTASLSFVGLGEQPPHPAFGQMISDGSNYLPEQWWQTIFPALAIIFLVLGFNFVGDGIRDMFDKGSQS